jgi:hypothetical protein
VPHVVTFAGQYAAVQPDGKIIVSGEEARHIVLTRFKPNASRDPKFGHNGRVVAPMPGVVRRVVPIGDHRLLVAGGGQSRSAEPATASCSPASTADGGRS